jgi:hypothetical protein
VSFIPRDRAIKVFKNPYSVKVFLEMETLTLYTGDKTHSTFVSCENDDSVVLWPCVALEGNEGLRQYRPVVGDRMSLGGRCSEHARNVLDGSHGD